MDRFALFAASFLDWDEGETVEAVAVARGVLAECRKDIGDGVEEPGAGLVAAASVSRWCARHAPHLAEQWAAVARRRLLDAEAPLVKPPRATEDGLLSDASVRLALSLAAGDVFGGAAVAPLYASGRDGLSLERLMHQVLGWAGPTVLICRSGGDVFAALADAPWRDQFAPFGSSGCLVLALSPTFAVGRPRRGPGSNQAYLSLNTKGSAAKRKGLSIGDGPPAIHVPQDLGDAKLALGSSLTFEHVALAPTAPRDDAGLVDVDVLEVWAVGDAAALEAASQGRATARTTRAKFIQKSRQVDKAKFLASDFDKEMLLGKTFATGADGARR